MQAQLSHLQIPRHATRVYPFRMGLNIRIRQLRKDRGLTLEQLAGRIGVSAPHLSEVERGKKNLNNHLIERLSDALGVKHTDLIGEEAPPPKPFNRLEATMNRLPEADQARVEAFALALLQSQQDTQPGE